MNMESSQRQMTVKPPANGKLIVRFAGPWRMADGVLSAEEVSAKLSSTGKAERLAFDTSDLAAWDSGLLSVLLKIGNYARQHNITVDLDGLPEGARRLVHLALAVPEKKDAARRNQHAPLLEVVGTATISVGRNVFEFLDFLGSATIAVMRFLAGKAQYRRSDLMLFIQETGANALGIVTLINILLGLILAFVGGVQLRAFGAQIYVADLVGLATTRELAAIMTGIIMAGRTGAAYAAQLGTMQVNEEIDALSTMGISALEFLVLPRMLALILMMPLLCIYSDLMGILGGVLVGTGMLDLTLTEYFNETVKAVGLFDIALGIFKGGVFGVLVALAGCLRGMQCGRSAQAVGAAATSAVVMGIVLIIVGDGIFAVITDALGL